MTVMTTPRAHFAARFVAIPAAVVLGIGSLGCGVIDTVRNVVDTAGTLSEFSDRLGKAASLTYTAEYRIEGSDSDTVGYVQQPPNSATVKGDGRMIFTPEHMIFCGPASGRVTCQKAPNHAAAAGDPTLVAGVAGPGFITPEVALGMVAIAALVPDADVETSERTIAGQKSLCADVTGIKDPNAGPDEVAQDFSVCVTESGVLAAFNGTTDTGEKASLELVSYSDRVDGSAFAPPAGAEIVDVSVIQS